MANAKTIEIMDDADLGIAMLIAEFGDGNYQPVAAVVSMNEAREIAASDMRALRKNWSAAASRPARSATSYGRRGPTAAIAR